MGSAEERLPTNKIHPPYPKRRELTLFIELGSAPRCPGLSAPAAGIVPCG